MTKKKVFVISHSHWDREWYMPFEKHHLRLVKLLDEVLDLIDHDPKFNSFQLDGQAIIIDDYLAVRPENEGRIRQAIAAGKLRVGPFYVLQDDFLISPEAHVKDFQIGRATAEKYGPMMGIGYFPDTFGNMGQTPQMLRLAGLDAVAFGRGVKPTGLNNQVSEAAFESSFSEMKWSGPDKSEVLGILFANWYSNGNEIPTDPAAAKIYWTQKLADVEKYASTDNLLMMNGVDHQPVQKDVTKALAVAQELFPDYEFIHSNFDDYLAAVKADLPENLSEVKGELTSQETDGWYTLTNTASSRIYLKQKNTEVQHELITEATQLAAAFLPAAQYPKDQLTYAWKLLLQNDIHDSITGCSVDEVHREMMTRFEKVEAIAQSIRDEAQAALTGQIDTSVFPEGTRPFVLINPSDMPKTGTVKVEVELDRALFADGSPDAQFAKMQLIEQRKRHYQIIDANGQPQSGRITDFTTRFGADLPEDRFRVPYMAVYAEVEVHVDELPAFSWQTLALQEVKTPRYYADRDQGRIITNGHILENKWIKAEVSPVDGSLIIVDKPNQRTYTRQAIFEDVGDMGNEYIFKETADQRRIYSTDQAPVLHVLENNSQRGVLELTATLEIPVGADAQLDYEQRAVIDITHRQARRSQETLKLVLRTEITLDRDSRQLSFKVSYNNQAKNHRLRVLFPTQINSGENEAESIFEVVKRPNVPSREWENETNPQRQQAFVNVHDSSTGVTVANYGLNEYEVLPEDGTIALTLLRCTGELGDWGYFLTPEAQCLGAQTAEFALLFHGETEADRMTTYRLARASQIPVLSQWLERHPGDRGTTGQWMSLQAEDHAFAVTGIEQDAHGKIIARGYNMSQTDKKVTLKHGADTGEVVDFLDRPMPLAADTKLRGAEIRSYRFNK